MDLTEGLAFDYATERIGQSRIVHADCLEWLSRLPENTLHAIVTDPPYGVKEYDLDQLEKRANGKGGIWRIPPSFDGHTRAPLPRFTALNRGERKRLGRFFLDWGKLAARALRPGAPRLHRDQRLHFATALHRPCRQRAGISGRGHSAGADLARRRPPEERGEGISRTSHPCRAGATNLGASFASRCCRK